MYLTVALNGSIEPHHISNHTIVAVTFPNSPTVNKTSLKGGIEAENRIETMHGRPCRKPDDDAVESFGCENPPMRNRNCPECGSHDIKHLKGEGQMVCLKCGYVLEDRTISAQTGTPSNIRLPAHAHGYGYGYGWGRSGNWIPGFGSYYLAYRESSRAKGHNYSNPGKKLWLCNHCDFSSRSKSEVMAHLEEDHNYIIHPENRPQPEPPLVGHITCLEKTVWQCCHCDYKDRKNKVVKHLVKVHKLQVNPE